MSWPAVVLWICILGGALSRGPALLYMFSILACFGTLQMAPGDGIGGANIMPQVVCAVFLVGKIASQKSNLTQALAAAIDPGRIGLLTAFLLYALLTAVVLPRIFEGRVEIVPLSGMVRGPSLLYPSGGNLTQTGYLALSFATALTFSVVGSNKEFLRHFLLSVLAGGAALIVTGFVDLVTSTVGLSAVLDPFRNASYALLTDNEILGSKRVVGLMPEASSYGSVCVTAAATLTFLRPCFEPRMRGTVVPLMIVGLLLMSALSTSSSAYIGLAIFVVVFGINWLIRFTSPMALARGDLHIEFSILVAAGFAIFCIVVLTPTLLDPVYNMVDVMIFQKSSTDSYFERSMWTSVAWQAFLSTNWLGVGFGGLRTSNWFVSILGSSGIVGALLMFGFMIKASINVATPTSPFDRELKRALRFSLVPWLVMNWFIGTTPDIGVTAASFYGILMAARDRPRQGPDLSKDASDPDAPREILRPAAALSAVRAVDGGQSHF